MKFYTGLLAAVLCLGLTLSVTSCSAKRVRTEMLSQEFLFPLGTYQHNVKIKTIHDRAEDSKEFAFHGVVQLSKEMIKISILSPFGTTLVRIQEDRTTGKVEFESYLEAFKKYESKVQDYYSILKLLLVAPSRLSAEVGKGTLRTVRQGDNGKPAEIETQGLEQKAVFIFKKYDENGIPEEIQIQHPRFTVDIRVSGYEV